MINIWGCVCMSLVWCFSQTRTQYCKAVMLSLVYNTFLGSYLWLFCCLALTQILCPWIAAVRGSQLAERSKCVWIHLLPASGSCLSGKACSGFSSPVPPSFQCLLCSAGRFPDLWWNEGWGLCELCGHHRFVGSSTNTLTAAAQSLLCFGGVGGGSPRPINEHCREAQLGSWRLC